MKNQRLVNFRENQNKTAIEMAEELNLSFSYYDKIERKQRNPSFNFIQKFKQRFPESDINYIFFDKQPHETCIGCKPTGTEP